MSHDPYGDDAPAAAGSGPAVAVRPPLDPDTLLRQALHLAAVVNGSEDAIVSKDLDGVVQTWNRAAERMFGYTAAEMVGRSITVIIPADRLAEETEVLSRVRQGRSVDHFETVRRRRDGTCLDVSLSVSPIRTPDGGIIGASKIARDITLQRRLVQDMEDASRVKDEFLAMLSHELRTPLNAVLGYTRMLREGQVSEGRQSHAFEIIERNAQTLSRLVADVLDVSSIVTGRIRLTLERTDVAQVVRIAVDSLRPSAAAKGVAFAATLPEGPLFARADGARLQQVVWNLLTNAVRFTPPGGRVAIDVTAEVDGLRIAVADTGVGIPAAALPRIFERFWQGEPAQATHPRGLGLGLSLARHFVELHGGTITAASDGAGRGARFVVRLPPPSA